LELIISVLVLSDYLQKWIQSWVLFLRKNYFNSNTASYKQTENV